MTTSLMRHVESQLSSDTDGTYKKELLQLLNKNKEDFASAKQDCLVPDKLEMLEKMEQAAEAAISVISNFKTDNKAEEKSAQENVSSFNSILAV